MPALSRICCHNLGLVRPRSLSTITVISLGTLGPVLQQFHYRVHPGPGLVGAHDAPGHGNGASPVDPLMTMAVVSSPWRRVNRQVPAGRNATIQDPSEQRREAETYVQFGLAGARPVAAVVQPLLRYWRQRKLPQGERADAASGRRSPRIAPHTPGPARPIVPD